MKRLFLLVALAACLAACTGESPTPAGAAADEGRPVVIAANYPLYFFAGELAGDSIDLRFPAIEGDPALWVPDGGQAAELQAADLVLLNGAGYESWLAFVTVPQDRLLDTTAGLEARLLPLEEATVHQHGPEGEHSHAGTAFTTWLDSELAAEQARAIAGALSELRPQQAADIAGRLAELEQRLAQFDRDLQQAFDGLQGAPVIFSHPVYQYLQHRYGINGRSLHWEPGEVPGVKAWLDFQNLLREHPATLLIWEAEPLVETAGKLRESGVESVVFDTAANRPAQGGYFDVMASNLSALRSIKSLVTSGTPSANPGPAGRISPCAGPAFPSAPAGCPRPSAP
jgi:zinc transport system substrate-binding protein